jgi:ankyrin repeat protein
MRRRKARPSHRASWALAGAAAALVLCGPQAVRVRAAETPLIQAVKAGDARAVKAVLRPSTVNVPETDGTTALHWAVQADDLATVELLLRGGADPRARNRRRSTRTPHWSNGWSTQVPTRTPRARKARPF